MFCYLVKKKKLLDIRKKIKGKKLKTEKPKHEKKKSLKTQACSMASNLQITGRTRP